VRRVLVTLVLLSAVAVAVPGEAAAIIQIDRGIAGVRLNNTKAQVRASAAAPTSSRASPSSTTWARSASYSSAGTA
jgi:hypothetical protein